MVKYSNPVGKIAKKQSEEVRFQNYTPTDWFFGDFAHWRNTLSQ